MTQKLEPSVVLGEFSEIDDIVTQDEMSEIDLGAEVRNCIITGDNVPAHVQNVYENSSVTKMKMRKRSSENFCVNMQMYSQRMILT